MQSGQYLVTLTHVNLFYFGVKQETAMAGLQSDNKIWEDLLA